MDIRAEIRKHGKAIGAVLAVAVAVTGYTTCAEDDRIAEQVSEIVSPLIEQPPAEP